MRRNLALTAAALRIAARASLAWPVFLAALTSFGAVVRPVMQGLGFSDIRAYGISLLAQLLGAIVLWVGERWRASERLNPYLFVIALSAIVTAGAFHMLWWAASGDAFPVSELLAACMNGAALILAFHVVFANVRYIGHTYSETFMRLRDVQQEIRALRASSAALLQQEHRTLASRAQKELGPNLLRLAALCDATPDMETQGLVHELQRTIDDAVRPLSHALLEGDVEVPRPAATEIRPRLLGFPRTLDLRAIFRPEFLIVIPLPLYLTTQYGLYGASGLSQGLVTTAVEYAAMLLVLRALPTKRMGRAAALTWVAVIPMVATLPGAAVIEVMIEEPHRQGIGFGAVYLRELGLAPVFAIALAYVFSIVDNLAHTRAALHQAERDLSEELVRQSQHIWAARQQWAYHIHGSVQGLLTAAILHVQQQTIDWGEVRAQIRKASQALVAAPALDLTLSTVLNAVQGAWVGACEIRYDIDPRLAAHVEGMADSLFALNEVLKESVSNAIRHSGSSCIDVSLRLDGSCIEVVVAGDVGHAGGNNRPGLGTDLYDHVSTEWSLQGNVLRIVLPIG